MQLLFSRFEVMCLTMYGKWTTFRWCCVIETLASKSFSTMRGLWMIVAALVWLCVPAEAIRFELDRRECWVHEVPFDGDLTHVSFVVIKVHNSWGLHHHRRAASVGVDLTIEGPGGEQVYTVRQQTQGKINVIAIQKGAHKFCFQNRVSMLQTVDFNVHIGNLPRDGPIKDEHLHALMAQIARVEDALFEVQFEQHWLHSQTAQQAQVASGTSRRVLYKAAVESVFGGMQCSPDCVTRATIRAEAWCVPCSGVIHIP